jgi:hypothetical protein
VTSDALADLLEGCAGDVLVGTDAMRWAPDGKPERVDLPLLIRARSFTSARAIAIEMGMGSGRWEYLADPEPLHGRRYVRLVNGPGWAEHRAAASVSRALVRVRMDGGVVEIVGSRR